MTRISAVVTVYNGAWCIERALDSVLQQTRPPDEIVVSDDGSTDGTADLIERRYGARVRLLRLPHRGLTPSRRAALGEATGDWLALLDADDDWRPEKLERQLRCIADHPEVRWISSDGEYVSAEGVIRESWLSDYFDPVRDQIGDLFPALVARCFPLVSSTLIEARAYHEVGGFDPMIPYSQDYDLWLRLAARYPAAVLSDRLIRYWSSPGQLSRRYDHRRRDDLLLMRRVARGDFGPRREQQQLAARRAASLEYDLALADLRAGRVQLARERLRRSATEGPVPRRLMAAAGLLVPAWLMPSVMRAPWLKLAAWRAREPNATVPGSTGSEDAA